MKNFSILVGFYASTLYYCRFFKKNQFLYCLLRTVAMLGGPMVDTKGKTFEI